MEGDVGTGAAPPIFLPGRFSDAPGMAKKRDFPWTKPGFHRASHQQQIHHMLLGSGRPNPSNSNGWNPKLWDWDSLQFTAKPLEDAPEASSLGTLRATGAMAHVNGAGQGKNVRESTKTLLLSKGVEEGSETLTLKIGIGACAEEQLVMRPNKRVRSGSPGSSVSYPMCQVDSCKTDLSNAKDYHRRHKVCELHSKTAKALVGQQIQRFCQQCSRFHPLPEFDEGKRSCRCRLAGHNRRRRKTEDASANILVPGSHDGKGNGTMDIANLVVILAHLQGNTAGNSTNMAPLTERDRLQQILDKVGNLSPAIASTKTEVQRGFDLNVSESSQQILQVPQQSSWKQPSEESGNPTAPSTMNLLAVLSSALASSNPNTLTTLLHGSSDGNGNSTNNRTCQDTSININSHSKSAHSFTPVGGRDADFNAHSQFNSSEHSVQLATTSIPLQLFGSAEDDSPPKLGPASKYPSSQSGNLVEDRSPSCSPPIAKRLLPLQVASKRKDESLLLCKEEHATAEASTSCGLASSLELFKDQGRQIDNQTVQNIPCPGGYSSSSGSEQPPSSSNLDAQDRTGRISFKLFNKDPSNLPGTLRTEILNWLSHSPSEIESYIRPGCVVLSIYLCMSSTAWHELEEDILQRVNSLINYSESEFWKNARFLIRTSRQLASHNDGKVRVCKSWRTLSAPELTSISPIAVMGGQETALVLKGRNLTVPGTIIQCTSNGGYSSKDAGSTYPGTICEDSTLQCFILPKGSPYSYGRYFIEVDRCFKGNSFPIIIADAEICQELRSLESGFDEDVGTVDTSFRDQCLENVRPQSREDIVHFLNELGWLFQRKSCLSFSTLRFKYLFMFSVERDFSALVKKLLDIVLEKGAESDSILHESLELLLELQLLNRAVKRKCRKMADMLLNYSVKNKVTIDSRVYLFPPNSSGPGGLTPLHLAASMQDAEGMVDALTNDPQEIGLNCWPSVLDDSGQSPSMCASSRNNHSYNMLVARKLADKENGRVSIMIGHGLISMDKSWQAAESPVKHGDGSIPAAMAVSSCAQCALAESRPARITRGKGLLQRPYVHSVLAIAAVCVCVCLFLRGAPWVGSVAPFKWEYIDFGPR